MNISCALVFNLTTKRCLLTPTLPLIWTLLIWHCSFRHCHRHRSVDEFSHAFFCVAYRSAWKRCVSVFFACIQIDKVILQTIVKLSDCKCAEQVGRGRRKIDTVKNTQHNATINLSSKNTKSILARATHFPSWKQSFCHRLFFAYVCGRVRCHVFSSPSLKTNILANGEWALSVNVNATRVKV